MWGQWFREYAIRFKRECEAAFICLLCGWSTDQGNKNTIPLDYAVEYGDFTTGTNTWRHGGSKFGGKPSNQMMYLLYIYRDLQGNWALSGCVVLLQPWNMENMIEAVFSAMIAVLNGNSYNGKQTGSCPGSSSGNGRLWLMPSGLLLKVAAGWFIQQDTKIFQLCSSCPLLSLENIGGIQNLNKNPYTWHFHGGWMITTGKLLF